MFLQPLGAFEKTTMSRKASCACDGLPPEVGAGDVSSGRGARQWRSCPALSGLRRERLVGVSSGNGARLQLPTPPEGMTIATNDDLASGRPCLPTPRREGPGMIAGDFVVATIGLVGIISTSGMAVVGAVARPRIFPRRRARLWCVGLGATIATHGDRAQSARLSSWASVGRGVASCLGGAVSPAQRMARGRSFWVAEIAYNLNMSRRDVFSGRAERPRKPLLAHCLSKV